MPYYDPTKNVKNVPIDIRLAALERLVKNIYHCKEIIYDVSYPEEGERHESEMYGSIYMVNLNDDPFMSPKLHDCCDESLTYEVFARIVPDEFAKEMGEPDSVTTELGLEVWFGYSPNLRIREIEKKDEDISSK